MFLAKLLITRKGYIGEGYGRADPTKPLVATIEIVGEHGKTEINLPPEVSDRVIALIADELATQARAVADAMTADFVLAGTTQALPSA